MSTSRIYFIDDKRYKECTVCGNTNYVKYLVFEDDRGHSTKVKLCKQHRKELKYL